MTARTLFCCANQRRTKSSLKDPCPILHATVVCVFGWLLRQRISSEAALQPSVQTSHVSIGIANADLASSPVLVDRRPCHRNALCQQLLVERIDAFNKDVDGGRPGPHD